MVEKNSLNRKRLCFVLAASVCLTLLVSLHGTPAASTAEPDVQVVSGALMNYDLDKLMAESSLIVLGTVKGTPHSFQVRRVDAGTEMMTDYTVTVDTVLLGQQREEITVRLFGGTVGNKTVIYQEGPVLTPGKQYLLFLVQPGRGGSYNTAGDYYYVRGMHQGAYEVQGDGTYRSALGKVLRDTQLVVPADVLERGPYDARAEQIRIWTQNYEGNMFTKEYYDQLIAELDVYAEIID